MLIKSNKKKKKSTTKAKSKSVLKSNKSGQKTVKDFKKGDYICINSNKKKYIKGDYDRAEKKFHLIDTKDVWGNGRYVKGSTIANEAPDGWD